MLKAERINAILEILHQDGAVNISDLSDRFGVTSMTIRRDLFEIESQENICRTHGGAIYQLNDEHRNNIPTLERLSLFQKEKIRIAKKAVEMIKSGDTVFIGSGTTTFYLALELQTYDNITIVTNSLSILNHLAVNGKMNVVLLGGFLRRAEYSLIGHFTTNMTKEIYVDIVFLGMNGIHPRFGFTSNHPQEILTDQAILQMSSNIIVLADHTKIGRVAPSKTAEINAAKIIITSRGASRETLDSISEQGVKVIVV